MTARETADGLMDSDAASYCVPDDWREMAAFVDLRDAIEAAVADAYRRGEESRPKTTQRKPVAIWDAGEAALYHKAPASVQDAWDKYAQREADLYDASEASSDRSTSVLYQWSPPLSFSAWRYAEVEGGLETTEADRKSYVWALKNGIQIGGPGVGDYTDVTFLAVLRDTARLTAQVAALKAERDAAHAHAQEWQMRKAMWKECAYKLEAERDAANARAERLARAVDRLQSAIEQVNDIARSATARAERLADNAEFAVKKLGHALSSAIGDADWRRRIIDAVRAALLTEPEAKGGDPAPVPATTEKTDG